MASETIDIAKKIVEAAADKQASEVVLLDTKKVCSFADYFIICSGQTEPQIKAISQAIDKVLKEEAITPHHSEGNASSGWVLIDLGEIIVHILTPFEREYYQLENLWSQAALLIKIM